MCIQYLNSQKPLFDFMRTIYEHPKKMPLGLLIASVVEENSSA